MKTYRTKKQQVKLVETLKSMKFVDMLGDPYKVTESYSKNFDCPVLTLTNSDGWTSVTVSPIVKVEIFEDVVDINGGGYFIDCDYKVVV